MPNIVWNLTENGSTTKQVTPEQVINTLRGDYEYDGSRPKILETQPTPFST